MGTTAGMFGLKLTSPSRDEFIQSLNSQIESVDVEMEEVLIYHDKCINNCFSSEKPYLGECTCKKTITVRPVTKEIDGVKHLVNFTINYK